MKLRQNREIPNFSLFTMTHSLLKDAKFSFDKKNRVTKKKLLSLDKSHFLSSPMYISLSLSPDLTSLLK